MDGIFIRSKEPLPRATLLKFEIHLDDEVLEGVGRVAWTRPARQATEGLPAGMGVKFVKLAEGSADTLQKLVEAHGALAGSFEDRRESLVPFFDQAALDAATAAATANDADQPDAEAALVEESDGAGTDGEAAAASEAETASEISDERIADVDGTDTHDAASEQASFTAAEASSEDEIAEGQVFADREAEALADKPVDDGPVESVDDPVQVEDYSAPEDTGHADTEEEVDAAVDSMDDEADDDEVMQADERPSGERKRKKKKTKKQRREAARARKNKRRRDKARSSQIEALQSVEQVADEPDNTTTQPESVTDSEGTQAASTELDASKKPTEEPTPEPVSVSRPSEDALELSTGGPNWVLIGIGAAAVAAAVAYWLM